MFTVLTCFRIAFVSCDEVNLGCSLLVMASLYKKMQSYATYTCYTYANSLKFNTCTIREKVDVLPSKDQVLQKLKSVNLL